MSTADKILQILENSKEVRINDLVGTLGTSRQMVHRAMKQLLEKGLVAKVNTAPRTSYKAVAKHKATSTKPLFHKRIFWDVDFENIDYDSKADFVIARVFERGDVEDIRNCRRYYGDEKVAEVLLNVKFLPLHTLYLASAVIDKPIEDFRCYTKRQSNPIPFPY